MRRSLVPFTGPESLVHTQSSADFITTTSGFRFSVHTRLGMRARATEEWDIFMALPALTIMQRVAENAANSFHLTNLIRSNGINCCDDNLPTSKHFDIDLPNAMQVGASGLAKVAGRYGDQGD